MCGLIDQYGRCVTYSTSLNEQSKRIKIILKKNVKQYFDFITLDSSGFWTHLLPQQVYMPGIGLSFKIYLLRSSSVLSTKYCC